ncbi:MAG: Crp/Fnr family transcriptional regulator [Prevotella sp.]|nr:Crp/Fnr family transcriptional regulator [Prevotella sp.]
MLNIYERLLLLPLFQGMNNADLTLLAGSTKFGFQRHEPGKTVVRDGDVCDHLHFLMNGTLRVVTEADDHGYSLTETMSAPDILQPERIFGLTQRFTRTFVAQSACNCMTLQKDEVMRLADEFLVFRLNLLNIVSAQSHRMYKHLWHPQPSDLGQRIVRFVAERSLRPAGPKQLHVKMTRLAQELNDSRINISRALNRLQDDGMLSLGRGKIEIPALERLLA